MQHYGGAVKRGGTSPAALVVGGAFRHDDAGPDDRVGCARSPAVYAVAKESMVNRASPAARVPQTPPEYGRVGRSTYLAGAFMLAVGAITLVLMALEIGGQGYAYLLLYSIPSNSAVSLFPHEPVLIYYGKFANLWGVSAAATAGTVVAGFLDHRVFVPLLNVERISAYKENRLYLRTISLFMRYPFATLVATGLTPIPFFPFKFLSFSIGYPLVRYLGALAVGRFPRYWLLAWVGAELQIPNSILFGSVAVVFAIYAVRAVPRALRRKRQKV